MTMRLNRVVALCAAGAFATAASAQINYLTAERSLEGFAGVGGGGYLFEENIGTQFVGTTGFEDFDEEIEFGRFGYMDLGDGPVATDGAFADGRQASSLGADLITVNGDVEHRTGSPVGTSYAAIVSTVVVTFELGTDADFVLDFSVARSYGTYTLTGAGFSWDRSFDQNTFDNFSVDESLTGTLSAGVYELVLLSGFPEGDERTDFDFSLSVTPVPAPASAALLGLGGLAMTRRRR